MARSRHFSHSVLLAYISQSVVMCTGLWLTPFLLRELGTVQYGIWIVAQQIFTYISLLDLGVVALLPREIAYVAGRHDARHAVAEVIGRAIRLLTVQTPAVGALLLATAWVMNVTVPIRSFCLWSGLAVTLLFPFRLPRATCEGLQDLGFIGASFLIGWTAGFGTTVFTVLTGWGLYSLLAGWVVAQVTDALLCIARVSIRWPFAVPSWRTLLDSTGTMKHLTQGLWASVSQVAQVLIYGTDSAIVGRMFGPAAIVPYTCTGKLTTVLANYPQHIMRAAEPGLSQMRVAESRRRVKQVVDALALSMLIASGFVTVVCLAVNPSFVQWWVGKSFFSGRLLTALFGASMMLRHINVAAIYTLFALGQEKAVAWASFADGIVSTVLSIVFAWALHSPLGVVIGSIASTACILAFANGPRLARQLGVGFKELIQPLRSWMWRMVLVGIAATFAGRFANQAGGFARLVLLTVLVGGAYLLWMLPVIRNSALEPYTRPLRQRLRIRTAVLLESAVEERV